MGPVAQSSINCVIRITGNRAFLSGHYPLKTVKDITSYFVEGYRFSPLYRNKIWDGKEHLFDVKTQSMPSGLVNLVVRELQEQYENPIIKIIDERVVPDFANNEDGFNLHGIEFGKGKFDYQLEAAKAAIKAKQCILKIATNGGKTEIAIAITKYLKSKTLFIVPSIDLLHQTRKRFALRLQIPEEEIGIIGDKQFQIGEWVTIALVDSLYTRMKNVNIDLEKHMKKQWQLLFIDECHTASSDTFYEVLEHVHTHYRIGMSGTPLDRSDGADLKLIAQTGDVVYEINNKLLIDRGVSSPVRIQFVKIEEPKVDSTNYKAAHKKAVQLNEFLNTDIEEWTAAQITDNKRVLVLIKEIAHGKQLDTRLKRHHPHIVKFLHGSEDSQTRIDSLKAFSTGDLRCIIGTKILYQGIDTEAIDVMVFADIGKSRIVALQAIGRGLRIREGKKELLVRDYANFCHKWFTDHSLRRLKMYKAENCFRIEML